MKKMIKKLVSSDGSLASKYFDISIQILIVLSVLSFSIDTLPNQSQELEFLLDSFEVFTISIFTIEYLIRLMVAQKKLNFIFSFFGLIDLLAIVPFYLFTGADMRSLRLFRLLRLFKLFRYSQAINLYKNSFKAVRDELAIFGTVAIIILYLSGVGIYYFEHDVQPQAFQSIFDGLWWALSTLTTVGYGDIYPVTTGGKFFTFIVLALGLGIVGVVTGLMASGMGIAREQEKKKNEERF
jgi:voltage-gated potassium channel